MGERIFKNTPSRLARVFSSHPLYFITFNTLDRAAILAQPKVHNAFIDYCRRGAAQQIGVGKYMIMPDHVHLFVRMPPGESLGRWISGLKRVMSKALTDANVAPVGLEKSEWKGHWQPGFFDHVLRNDESYSQKWVYVAENPARAGLVDSAGDWPFQGEIGPIQGA